MASELVPVEQVDRDAANIAFDDVLGDAGSYAEYMRPSYREGGVRTLTEAFTRHRLAALESQASRIAELEAAVIAFGAPWAVQYAREFGFPEGHLHPAHYDILAHAGARLDSFVRGDPALLGDREG